MSNSNVIRITCENPRTIVNRRYTKYPEWARHWFQLNHDYYLTIPCGRCRLCKSKIAKEWKVRLHYELQSTPRHKIEGRLVPKAFFLTFTLKDEYLTDDEKVYAPWLVRFRDNYRKKYKKSPRYFAITDRGSQYGRLHLHMVIFDPACSSNVMSKHLKSWYSYGFFHIRWIYSETIDEYITGYLSGDNLYKDVPVKHGKAVCDKALRYKPRVFVSKGLGCKCADESYIKRRDDGLVDINGYLYALPRYYRDKWYTKRELYYKTLINTVADREILPYYGYNRSIIPYQYRGRIVSYNYLPIIKETTERFTTPAPPPPPVTDWDSVLRDMEEHDRIIDILSFPTDGISYDGLHTRWSIEHYYKLDKFPF